MALVPVKELGKGGVIKDTSPALLPENVFTDALNVRFMNGSVEKMPGDSIQANITGVTPQYGIHWRRPDTSYNVLFKDGKAIAKKADDTETTMFNSVDAAYTNSKWQLETFGGGYAIVANNNAATPMYALFNDPTADITFQPFPGWNYIAGTSITAKVIRPFGYSLVAANLTFTAAGPAVTRAPVTLRVSVQAVVGGFPTIWQPGLTTDTADEFEVNASSEILDLCELRGNMMIYTYNSIHQMANNGGVMVVRPYAQSHGILNTGCVTEFDNQHFVVDRNDIYVHNGSGQIQSVAEGRVKRFFFQDLNSNAYDKVFVQKNTKFKEIWVCYPDNLSTGKCNKAMVWNYADNTWTFRKLAYTDSMFVSPKIEAGAFVYVKSENVLSCHGTSRVLLMDDTFTMVDPATGAAAEYSSYATREKLFAGDPFGSNLISGIAPILQNINTNDVVNITITSQNTFDVAADFSNTSGRDLYTIYPKNTSQGYKVDARQIGRFLNVKIESLKYWKLAFMALDINPAGRR